MCGEGGLRLVPACVPHHLSPTAAIPDVIMLSLTNGDEKIVSTNHQARVSKYMSLLFVLFTWLFLFKSALSSPSNVHWAPVG